MKTSEALFREWLESYAAKGYVTGSVQEHLTELFAAALSSARDAALEEAKTAVHTEAVAMTAAGLHKEARALTGGAKVVERLQHAPSSRIGTAGVLLQSQPATVVPKADVAEAILGVADMDDEHTRALVSAIAKRLGVDLDATAKKCQRHPLCVQDAGHAGTCGDLDATPAADLGVTCDCTGAPHRHENGCPDTTPEEYTGGTPSLGNTPTPPK